MCILDRQAAVRKDRLYAAWRQWAEDEGERGAAMKSQRWLFTQLLTRGIFGKHDHDKRMINHGIGLVDDTRESLEQLPTRGQARRAEV
jgi:phage/plasmid-associated DNA primase